MSPHHGLSGAALASPRFAALLAAVSAALLAVGPGEAHASDGTETRYRYGYQTAIMDAGAAGFLTTGFAMDEPAVYWTGVFAFYAGAPLVHFAQKNPDSLYLSLGVRVGAPLILGLAGGAIGSISGGRDSDVTSRNGFVKYAGPGLVIGALLAVVIDSQALAVRDRPPRAVRLQALPLARRDAAGAMLVGQF